jgi:soluble lytic murein transglycosylase-like protein
LLYSGDKRQTLEEIMAVERPLTIRDYIEPRRAAVAGARIAREVSRAAGSFKDLLSREAAPKKAGPVSALGLSDYFARPVMFTQASRLEAAGGRIGSTTAAPTEAPKAADAEPNRRQAGPADAMGRRRRLREAAGGVRLDAHRGRPPAAGSDAIEQAIQQAASRYNLSANLIRSVIRAESAFRPDAVSPAGAQGLMQLMPETAKELGVADPFDVRQNIDGGARYLRQMLDRFDGNIRLALSAYNAGPGAVEKYEGQVPYAETRDYVKRVLRFVGQNA